MEAVSVRWAVRSWAGRSPPPPTCQILTSSFQSGRSCVGRGRPFSTRSFLCVEGWPFLLKICREGLPRPAGGSDIPAGHGIRQASPCRKPCPSAKHASKHCPLAFVFCAEYERRPPNMPTRAALLQIFVALSARPLVKYLSHETFHIERVLF